ncbi:UNVERIFIED_CONTAM: reverse transcriptase (RNA-dependent DNA polymerase) [Acetivibrio alkalicellulosi]
MDEKQMLCTIIEKGYFPKELIPPFETKKLSSILDTVVIPRLNSFTNTKSKYCDYSISNVNHIRRILGIPNPLNQIRLGKVIVDNWSEITHHIYSSTLSLSKPIFKDGSKSALSKEVDLSDISHERATRSTNTYYLLRADIARFYSTIYTHSIPWALHTKPVAKSQQRNRNLLGNLLDIYVREAQDNQTLGIPVGPDTSLVISEIIGAAIDKKVYDKIKGIKNGFRYLDDYFLYFNSKAEAETALAEFSIILGEYELELNTSKTKIISLPEPLEPRWVYELRLFEFDDHEQKKSIISYFSKAFDMAKMFPDDRVLLYSLNRIEKVSINIVDWELFEAMVLKVILAEPDAIPLSIKIFLKYYKMGHKLNCERIKNTIHEIISYHGKYGRSKEVAWALWMCYIFQISIEPDIINMLSCQHNPIVALIILDLQNKNLLKDKVDISIWQSLMNPDSLYNEDWLLAYEASVKGWINTTSDYIKDDPFFSVLRANNVNFYNDKAGTTITEITPTEPVEGFVEISDLPDEFFEPFEQNVEYGGDISGAH